MWEAARLATSCCCPVWILLTSRWLALTSLDLWWSWFVFFSFLLLIDWLGFFFFFKQFMSIKVHIIKYSNTGDIRCFREKQQAGSHLCRFCPSRSGLVEVSKVDTRMKRNLNKSTKFTSSPQTTAFFYPLFLWRGFGFDWKFLCFIYLFIFKVSVHELLRPCLYCFSNPAWTNQLIL